jgi:recombination protein RecT
MSNAISIADVKKQNLRQVKSVQHLLWNEQARDQLAAVAAKHMNPERMMRTIANAIRTTPKLQECEPMSFLGALMQCAALGLEPNDVRGLAYLIPFDKKAKDPQTGKWEVVRTDVQLIVGYRGLIDLARRSGHITSISANIHYSDDELWTYEEGTEAVLRHRPGPREGKKLHAYAIAKFTDGGHAYVVLPWSHVMKIRDGSQGWQQAVRTAKTDDAPWKKHEDEMAKKTAIRALAKYLPMSVEMVDAMTVDEKAADYRAFAMDPMQGIAPVLDEVIDAEAEEADGPTQIEQNRTQDPVQDGVKRPSRADLQKQHREETARKPVQEPRKTEVYNPPKEEVKQSAQAQDSEPEPEVAEDPGFAEVEQSAQPAAQTVDPYSSPFGKTFLKDVTDMGWDAAWDFHGDQIQTLKATDPAFHAALMAEAHQIDPNTPED